MIHINMMGSIIFIYVLTYIPRNDINNHPIMVMDTITWFSLSKMLRFWKLHVGKSMAYKTIYAFKQYYTLRIISKLIAIGVLAPIYSSMSLQFSGAPFKLYKFQFFVDDMNCYMGVVAILVLTECKDEDSHSQVSSYFGSWSPGGLPNFQRAIIDVKTPLIEDFFISLESF